MLARSAASLSTTAATTQSNMSVTSQFMDANDCKFIVYKASQIRLTEMKRLLGVLVPNLKKRSSQNKNIVPLVTYMLPLLAGPVFNVNAALKEKYNQIVQGQEPTKDNKDYDVTPRDWLTYVMDSNTQNQPLEGCELVEFKKELYDKDKQWLTVTRLLKLIDEVISTYNNKFKSANLLKKTYSKSIEDLIKPSELSLCLDLAVLITDYERDTSEASFRKLQWQVIEKFLATLHSKVEPTLKTYYKSLLAYQSGKLMLYKLPFPEWTIHRMFAFTVRMISLMKLFGCELRVLYYPNRKYLNDLKTKLVCENVYKYDLLITQIEKLCADPLYQIKESKEMMQFFQKYPYSLPKSLPQKTHEFFIKKVISTCINHWNNNTKLVEDWVEMWKFCDKNNSAKEKIESSNEEQLIKMYDERYTVDKLVYLEHEEERAKLSNKKSIGIVVKSSSSSSPNKLLRKLSPISGMAKPKVRSTKSPASSSSSNSNSNSALSSGMATPKERSRRSSVDRGLPKGGRLPGLTKTNTNERLVAPLIHISETSSVSNSGSSSINASPLGSRRGSIKDESAARKMVINRTVERTRSKIGNRPRSASLQSNESAALNSVGIVGSPLSNNRLPKPVSNQSQLRSNSLESNSALNRKMVQDTFKHLMANNPKPSNLSHSPTSSPMRPSSPIPSRSNSNKVSSKNNGAILSPEPKGKSKANNSNEKIKTNGVTSINIDNSDNEIVLKPLPHESKDTTTGPVRPVDESVNNSSEGTPAGSESTPESMKSAVGIEGLDKENLNVESGNMESGEPSKKVRFVGVPPMTEAENPKPTRKGWYKKPAVLHYPPVPQQVTMFRDRLRQEGMVFRTSLRDTVAATSNEVGKKGGMMLSLAIDNPPVKEISSHSRFASKLREKLTR